MSHFAMLQSSGCSVASPATRHPSAAIAGLNQLAGLLDLTERVTSGGTWMLELPAGRLTWSHQLARLLECPEGVAATLRNVLHFYAPQDRHAMRRAFVACLLHSTSFDRKACIITAAGRKQQVRTVGEVLRDPAGHPVCMQGVVLVMDGGEVTAPCPIGSAASTPVYPAAGAFAMLDRESRFIHVDPAAERLLGKSSSQMLGQALPAWLDRDGANRWDQALQAALEQGTALEQEAFCEAIGKWLELHAYAGEIGLTLQLRDITERKFRERAIARLAFHDPLTELPNRQQLMERLQKALQHSPAGDRIGALLFIDLDNFKVLNDSFGHAKGDLLLQSVARRLVGCTRSDDLVARLGGDEFVVLCDDVGSDTTSAHHTVEAIAYKILDALNQPHDLAGQQHATSCSIGATLIGHDAQSAADLLRQTDLAMYQAKRLGRNALSFYTPSLQVAAANKASINTALLQALDRCEFELLYQPQMSAERLVGAEALLRWRRAGGPVMMPDEFLPYAEANGMALTLSRWTIETACLQLASWSAHSGAESRALAVNVGSREFHDPDFVRMVATTVRKSGIAPQRLKFELPNSLLTTQFESTIAQLRALDRIGIVLVIDDFGLGHSAWSRLKRMPVSEVKIDRRLLHNMLLDRADEAIVRGVVGLAQSLGLSVVAGGVETVMQHQFLLELGCQTFQGQLFCRPVPAAELEVFAASCLAGQL